MEGLVKGKSKSAPGAGRPTADVAEPRYFKNQLQTNMSAPQYGYYFTGGPTTATPQAPGPPPQARGGFFGLGGAQAPAAPPRPVQPQYGGLQTSLAPPPVAHPEGPIGTPPPYNPQAEYAARGGGVRTRADAAPSPTYGTRTGAVRSGVLGVDIPDPEELKKLQELLDGNVGSTDPYNIGATDVPTPSLDGLARFDNPYAAPRAYWEQKMSSDDAERYLQGQLGQLALDRSASVRQMQNAYGAAGLSGSGFMATGLSGADAQFAQAALGAENDAQQLQDSYTNQFAQASGAYNDAQVANNERIASEVSGILQLWQAMADSVQPGSGKKSREMMNTLKPQFVSDIMAYSGDLQAAGVDADTAGALLREYAQQWTAANGVDIFRSQLIPKG